MAEKKGGVTTYVMAFIRLNENHDLCHLFESREMLEEKRRKRRISRRNLKVKKR